MLRPLTAAASLAADGARAPGRTGFSAGGSRAPHWRRLGSGPQGSGVVARGILPGQGSNLCLLHWRVACSPRSHQASPQVKEFLKGQIQEVFTT